MIVHTKLGFIGIRTLESEKCLYLAKVEYGKKSLCSYIACCRSLYHVNDINKFVIFRFVYKALLLWRQLRRILSFCSCVLVKGFDR